ncbi:hypothetical protein G6F65_014552 [Rhizopus arrhizus]|nr:hypothetical protein G6F65_014552 [Rhizopus arrhizus]
MLKVARLRRLSGRGCAGSGGRSRTPGVRAALSAGESGQKDTGKNLRPFSWRPDVDLCADAGPGSPARGHAAPRRRQAGRSGAVLDGQRAGAASQLVRHQLPGSGVRAAEHGAARPAAGARAGERPGFVDAGAWGTGRALAGAVARRADPRATDGRGRGAARCAARRVVRGVGGRGGGARGGSTGDRGADRTLGHAVHHVHVRHHGSVQGCRHVLRAALHHGAGRLRLHHPG